ncbi:hypothetical protein [Maribacter sp. 2210JD10-5]|uniref:hypothetical protein n=1 Tax=Maribacter sp. 2210JD10-5 TaxID=3386272 RepID=UPI0039BCA020
MKQGITKCAWCLTEATNNEANCPTCGGPIEILEPWILKCGWCGTSNRRDLVKSCENCGGELPSIPGLGRPPDPPKAPRFITEKLRQDIILYKNMEAGIGRILIIFGFLSLCVGVGIIFILTGLFFRNTGRKKAKTKLDVLRNGVPTKGVIQEIKKDLSRYENRIHPYLITYTFYTPKGGHKSEIVVWDSANWKRQKNEHLWVLFDIDDITKNTIWPPMV